MSMLDQTGYTEEKLNAVAMLDAAALGELYYALIGVDVTQPLSSFVRDELGIDVAANFDEGNVVRAGTSRSQISRQDREINLLDPRLAALGELSIDRVASR